MSAFHPQATVRSRPVADIRQVASWWSGWPSQARRTPSPAPTSNLDKVAELVQALVHNLAYDPEIMMDVAEYRTRSAAAHERAAAAITLLEKEHHEADAASWEALAKMAERHILMMQFFKI
ncbi:hypothetical protein [Brevundimonas sp.]|uniref:hypothetical protein n=1 Tax=Brevundimonas sp. TaxID=1871086 RepID=UPI002D432CDF|nr:hypothetical protein [Brevundimonas sp.]HYC98763.1 hypothetical protein [Brevundimonas sp.]